MSDDFTSLHTMVDMKYEGNNSGEREAFLTALSRAIAGFWWWSTPRASCGACGRFDGMAGLMTDRYTPIQIRYSQRSTKLMDVEWFDGPTQKS